MSKTVLAELVTKMTVESSQFKRELERTTAKTTKFSTSQKQAANESNRLASSQRRTTASTGAMSAAFTRAANSAATLTGPMGGISSRLSTVATGMATVGIAGVALGAGIGALAFGVIASVSAFSTLEQGLLRTEALFKSTGGASGKTTEELEELTRSVALSTLASVEGVRQAVNVLQTFKSIQGVTFERTIKLSQDLAAVMGSDIKSSALQLGKALEDPITGLTALKRSGVSFSESQKEVIKSLVETGQVAAAQTMILNTLEAQVGGAGSAEAGGLAGATDTLSQRWQELLEGFGETSGIGDAVTYTLNKISGGIDKYNKAIGYGLSNTEKLTSLYKEQAEVREIIDSNGIVGGILEIKLAAITAEIKAIDDLNTAEAKIFKLGALARKKDADELAASLLAKNNATGLKTLSLLESQMADENQLVYLQLEKRLAAIQGLVLSEEEIRKRGFDNINDLQDYNIGLVNEQAQAEFEAITEKNNKIIQAEKDKNLAIKALSSKAFTSLQNDLAAENNPAELARQQMQARLEIIREYYGLENAEAAKATQAGIAAVEIYKQSITEKNNKIIQAEKDKNLAIKALSSKAFTSLQNDLAAENNPAELARQQMQARLDVIREYYGLESAEAAKATQAGVAAVESYKQAISSNDLLGTLSDSLSGLQDQISGTLGQMALGMTDGEEAAKALGRTIVTQLTGSMINYGIEQVIAYATGTAAATAAEAAKTLAVTGGIAAQTVAATGATAVLTGAGVASGASIAVAMAPAAAATSIATAGAAPAVAAPIALGTIGAIIAAIVGSVAIAGAREKGGPVSGGKTYLVGEKGPELFTPGATGQITSNDKMNKFSGNSQPIQAKMNITINGNANDDVIAQLDRQRKRFGRMVQQVINTPY
jgi:hypothetical protein